MTTRFTLILPHLRNRGNDAALTLCLECLLANTDSDFILMIEACESCALYPSVNRMFQRAPTDCCVYWSSDLFAAPHWDTPMLARWDTATIVTNVCVEPGVIGLHPENIAHDFGRTPQTFQREAFEQWTVDAPVPDGVGWGTPYMVSRGALLSMNGLREDLPPDEGSNFSGGDRDFFARWLDSGSHIRTMVRARSYVYHLQRWSDVREQEAEKRR